MTNDIKRIQGNYKIQSSSSSDIFVVDTNNNYINPVTTTNSKVVMTGQLIVNNGIYVNSNSVLTTVIINSGTGIGVSKISANVFTITNLGVQLLFAGTDTTVSASSGSVVIWSTATLQSITSRGATTLNAITINNATNPTSSTNGALIIQQGGIGVAGNIMLSLIHI